MRFSLTFGHCQGRTLFELLPDLFPPMLSEIEIALWNRFYDEGPLKPKAF